MYNYAKGVGPRLGGRGIFMGAKIIFVEETGPSFGPRKLGELIGKIKNRKINWQFK